MKQLGDTIRRFVARCCQYVNETQLCFSASSELGVGSQVWELGRWPTLHRATLSLKEQVCRLRVFLDPPSSFEAPVARSGPLSALSFHLIMNSDVATIHNSVYELVQVLMQESCFSHLAVFYF